MGQNETKPCPQLIGALSEHGIWRIRLLQNVYEMICDLRLLYGGKHWWALGGFYRSGLRIPEGGEWWARIRVGVGIVEGERYIYGGKVLVQGEADGRSWSC